MNKDFTQVVWDKKLASDVRMLIRLAMIEDLDGKGDLTTQALVSEESVCEASVRARENGIIAGLAAVPVILALKDSNLQWMPTVEDGDSVAAGDLLGTLSGSVASILTIERIVLNLVGKLSGIATLTKRYLDEVQGTNVRVYDTRKTTLGWRKLEKYAVHCGGGMNHRTGLYDAILIKDNHLVYGQKIPGDESQGIRQSVEKAKTWIKQAVAEGAFDDSDARTISKFKSCGIQVQSQQTASNQYKSCGVNVSAKPSAEPIVEVEVDTLEQLADVLPACPDIVLLDNMTVDQLREAVAIRNAAGVATELEASGGINLKTIRQVAMTGVERISCGALTHSAISLDVGLDF